MALNNVSSYLKIGSLSSSYKLLLMTATSSRPKLAPLFRGLLQPFVRDGEVWVRYRCYGGYVRAVIRVSELESDSYSVRELGVHDVYQLDRSFHPDLVIDGGGNIGLFTLRAAEAAKSSGDAGVRFVVCEPLPQNVEQIKKNLAANNATAEIMPVCLGGDRRSIPFYCREANQSSFDASKPYAKVLEIPVIPLLDAVGTEPAERILIKLDIEGMEVEVLRAFVPTERRAVYIVGEVHDYSVNAQLLENIFHSHGWTIDYYDVANDTGSFRACSPAALPLLPSMASIRTPSPV